MSRRNVRSIGLEEPKKTVPAMMYGALVLLLAWSALASAVVGIARFKNPKLALSFSPRDPGALAALADSELLKYADSSDVVRSSRLIHDLAIRSLRGEAVNARAIREVGVIADLSPATRPRAMALLGLANRISRRDLQSNLWFIETAVQRQDIAGALKYYDFALRTQEASQTLLFSTLTQALTEREIRIAFAPYVHARPPWLRDMLTYAIDNSDRPEHIADAVRLGGGLPKGKEFTGLQQTLIRRMIETAEFDAAKNFYLSLPGVKPDTLTSLSMTRETTDPNTFPLTWGGMKTATIDGAFGDLGPGGRQSLTGTATSGERGVVARKILFLTPGFYEVRSVRDTTSMSADSLATMTTTCLSQNAVHQIWSGDFKSRNAFPILTVPADCATQSFDIVLDGGNGQIGTEIRINAISIRKL